ncbi:MAG: thiamine-phosphate kinase [Pseudomonadota bacterium]
MSGKISGEAAFIGGYLAPLATLPGALGFEDDCAFLEPAPGQALVFKTDPIRAGVHFFADDGAADIAFKALAVNVSDLAAKAARPVAYLMSVSFPEAPAEAWATDFARGLGEAQEAFGLSLIGGDTDRADGPLSISITVVGEVPAGRMIQRGTAMPGDRLVVSGTLGAAAVGLQVRAGSAASDDQALQEAGARYLRPRPRLGLRAALRRYARAAMDLSDGLIKDAGRMAAASGCAVALDWPSVPVDPAAGLMAAGDDQALRKLATAHGDDYEILAAVPPDAVAPFIALAAAGGVTCTEIGQCRAGSGVTLHSADGADVTPSVAGYDHF